MSEKTAQKNEATGTLEVSFRGQTYVVDRSATKDIDIVEAIEDRKIVNATKMVLGPEQWAMFRASEPKPNLDTISELFDLLGEAIAGAKAGE